MSICVSEHVWVGEKGLTGHTGVCVCRVQYLRLFAEIYVNVVFVMSSG